MGQPPAGAPAAPAAAPATAAPVAARVAALDTATLDYLVANQGAANWIVAVSDATSAGQIELSTGRAVMAMGGFTGSDNALTLERLQAAVASGDLRFVSTGGGGGGGGQAGQSSSDHVLGHLGLHRRQRGGATTRSTTARVPPGSRGASSGPRHETSRVGVRRGWSVGTRR